MTPKEEWATARDGLIETIEGIKKRKRILDDESWWDDMLNCHIELLSQQLWDKKTEQEME